MENNTTNQNSFFQRNKGIIWILTGLLILFCFFRDLSFKNPFFDQQEKKDTAIINAINNNGDKISKGLDKIGDKVDKNTEENKKGFQKVSDSISSGSKRVADSISAKKCCIETPPCPKVKPKKPLVKKPSPKKPSLKKPSKKDPCPCDTTKKPTVVIVPKPKCEYILWNTTHTQKKIFSTREERKKFADEHGLIMHEEN